MRIKLIGSLHKIKILTALISASTDIALWQADLNMTKIKNFQNPWRILFAVVIKLSLSIIRLAIWFLNFLFYFKF